MVAYTASALSTVKNMSCDTMLLYQSTVIQCSYTYGRGDSYACCAYTHMPLEACNHMFLSLPPLLTKTFFRWPNSTCSSLFWVENGHPRLYVDTSSIVFLIPMGKTDILNWSSPELKLPYIALSTQLPLAVSLCLVQRISIPFGQQQWCNGMISGQNWRWYMRVDSR